MEKCPAKAGFANGGISLPRKGRGLAKIEFVF